MSEEKKKVSEETLEQTIGGYLDDRAESWFMSKKSEIYRRALKKGCPDEICEIMWGAIKAKKFISLETFKAMISQLIDISDL